MINLSLIFPVCKKKYSGLKRRKPGEKEPKIMNFRRISVQKFDFRVLKTWVMTGLMSKTIFAPN